MLEKYPTSIKVGAIINIIIGIFGIIFGVLYSEEWPFLIFGPFIAITLILFFISKFVLNNPTIKPIYHGIFWGLSLPAILFILILLGYLLADKLDTGGGSTDMAGLGGLILIIVLAIASIIIFVVSLLIGMLIAYKNSKNKIVLVITITLILLLIVFLYHSLLAIKANISPLEMF